MRIRVLVPLKTRRVEELMYVKPDEVQNGVKVRRGSAVMVSRLWFKITRPVARDWLLRHHLPQPTPVHGIAMKRLMLDSSCRPRHWPWFKITWSVASPRVAEQCDVNIKSINQPTTHTFTGLHSYVNIMSQQWRGPRQRTD
ncbi:hypothetical protein TNCV_2284131 [Trichonephila clavipes]|nr:hypothetical protein TNCV_2284131 [Trichonephila clavipes]